MSDFQNTIKNTKIRLCLDCGKCTVVCPVAKYDQNFNPRLLVQSALRNGGMQPVDEKIWSCISCNMCMERCNYNVQFTDFIMAMRNKALMQGVEVKYSHGGTPQAIMRMMGHHEIKQNRMGWLPKDIRVLKKSETAFFVGCAPYFDILFKDIGVKTIDGVIGALQLLNRADVPFTLLPNERCCGRDLLLLGDIDGFTALARANLFEFNKRGINKIITACPEGYHTFKVDYPKYIKNWTNIEVFHISEVIAPLAENGTIAFGCTRQRITYHDPCTLGRYSRIFDAPRTMLQSIEGIDLVEMSDNREKALCCGASPWAYCGATNKQIQQERLRQATETGAKLLVTACPKCQIHLKCAQKNTDNNVHQIEIRDICDITSQLLSSEEV